VYCWIYPQAQKEEDSFRETEEHQVQVISPEEVL
jgi:hypothetical protein